MSAPKKAEVAEVDERKYSLKKYLQISGETLDKYVFASLSITTSGLTLSKDEWVSYLSKVRS